MLAAALLSSCSKPKLEGTWKPVSLDGKEMEGDRQNMRFVFLDNAVFSMSNSSRNARGTWSYDEAKKEIVMAYTISDETSDVMSQSVTWSDVEITAEELKVTDPAGRITLKRD